MKIIDKIVNMSLFGRQVLAEIIDWIPRKEAIILLGSRQVGKTSLMYLLMQHLVKIMKISIEDIFYLDLEKMENLEMVNAGEESLLNFINEQSSGNKKKYVFIDEIQYTDNPTNLLKLLVDHHSDKIKIFATGSSALTIKKKFKDSLVGRKITFEVCSLSFIEYLNFKKEEKLGNTIKKYHCWDYVGLISNITHNKILKNYFEYSRFGGYPAVVLLKNNEEKKKYLNDIFLSYVQKDINTLFSLENIRAFNRIVKLLALNIGNLINVQEFAKESGIARQTVEKYFSILEETYICKFIQPYFTNKKKEIVKMSKVYFYDTGLRNRIINDFRDMKDRVDAGFLIENTVFKNLLKRVENKDNIKFWRMKYGVEVDFVLDEEKITPIEVKAKKTDTINAGMSSFCKNYKIETGIIVNKETVKKIDNIRFLPYYAV